MEDFELMRARILLQNPSPSQIQLKSNLEIKCNTIISDSLGISGSGPSSNFVIAKNAIKAGTIGIQLLYLEMTNPVVTGNVVCSDYWGIDLHHISEAVVNYNIVNINGNPVTVPDDPFGVGPSGILMWVSQNSLVANNIVTGNFVSGIFLQFSSTNTIQRNVVIGSHIDDDAGIRLFPNTSENTVKQNLILRVNQKIDDQGFDNIIIS